MCLLEEDTEMASQQQQQQQRRRESNRPSMDRSAAASAAASSYEAELWRSGGGFKRTEVNLTRGGSFRFKALP